MARVLAAVGGDKLLINITWKFSKSGKLML